MRSLISLMLLAAGVACARGTGATETSPVPGVAGAPRAAADLITEAEIARTTYSNALEIVQGLRPMMLRERPTSLGRAQPAIAGPTTGAIGQAAPSTPSEEAPKGVIVYFDDMKLGGAATLQTIPALRIASIRYVNGRDAQTRWGVGHGAGVIHVLSRK